jgi:phytoene dehydrogenase-like protein
MTWDAIIVGAGHNGLTCAGYLAQAGLRVKVLEASSKIGGATQTEEFHPGFRNSVYAYAVSLLNPSVISDLNLRDFGLDIIEKKGGNLSLLPDGALTLGPAMPDRIREIARFSERDALAYPRFEAEIETIALALRKLAEKAPPDLDFKPGNLLRLAAFGLNLGGLRTRHRKTLAELMTRSLGDYLDSWFESEELKGLLGLECAIGNFVDPYQTGTAYVLLHHAFGEVNGKTGAWGHARGGMGAISSALAASAQAYGADIEVDAPVVKLLIDRGKAHGVNLADGRQLHAPLVAAGIHPKTLLLDLIGSAHLSVETNRRIRAYKSHSATFRMNVALSGLPEFFNLSPQTPGVFEHTIEICPSLAYMSEAFRSAKQAGVSNAPIVSMWFPSVLDDSLAPDGQHVASLFCQHFQRHLPAGRRWDDIAEITADHVIDTVEAHAPGFRNLIVGRQITTPLDIERNLGMVGGDIFHGALHLDQLFSQRPIAGYAGYRMPIQGVYLCGSGAHPGGGVTGLPGRNAAQVILRDHRFRHLRFGPWK